MSITDNLAQTFGKSFSLERVDNNTQRLYAPIFHEDGDMYSIYLETTPDGLILRDYGETLMHLDYTFPIDTDNKRKVLSRIVASLGADYDDGELSIRTVADNLTSAVFAYAQLVSKVSNIDILSRETNRSLFFDNLRKYMLNEITGLNIKDRYSPTGDPDYLVDFCIEAERPLYLFGVDSDTKASRVVITCLNFRNLGVDFRSVVVHEEFEALSRYSRRQITNVSDKQFTALSDFTSEAPRFIAREVHVVT